jgi:hypothetical protein
MDINKISLNFLSKFFCENFDDDNYKYKLSIAISNLLGFDTESENEFEKIQDKEFKGNRAFDAIIYPSILMAAESDNMAIRRFSFHKKMKFVSADYLKIKNVNKTEFTFEEIDFANEVDDEGRIIWKGRKGNFVIPFGVEVVINQVGNNEFNIERKDGIKLYRD